ncbi:MAG: FHA domain-containing protein [Gemmatimonadota bacterium]|nr:MAG: FHA domain-containing protein [Gemmatimonadota bacterium]
MIDKNRAKKKIIWVVQILDNKGTEYPLDAGKTKIGRYPKVNDIVIDAQFGRVSREHCSLTVKETSAKAGDEPSIPDCLYKDIGSANGSYKILSGQRPRELTKGRSYPLEDGNIIRLGHPENIEGTVDIRFVTRKFLETLIE